MAVKTLVVFPSLNFNLSRIIPIPAINLFAGRAGQVLGIFSYQLTEALVNTFDSFIISLGWYFQLYESELIVNFIRSHKKTAQIMVAGMYAQMIYKELFSKWEIDYIIKGDNEGPLDMYLEGVNPRKIPNMVSKAWENPITYIFKKEDLGNLRYDLDWFGNYRNMLTKLNDPELADSIANETYSIGTQPSKSQFSINEFFAAPPAIHIPKNGCSMGNVYCKKTCLGGDQDYFMTNYGHGPLIMTNEQLIDNLHKIQLKKFTSVAIYLDSDWNYNLSEHKFNLSLRFHSCSPLSMQTLSKIADSFRESWLFVPLHRKSINWENRGAQLDLEGIEQLNRSDIRKIYLEVFDKQKVDENLIATMRANKKVQLVDILDYWLDEYRRNQGLVNQLNYDLMMEVSKEEYDQTDPDLVFKSK
jgi:hypothetical protein